MTRTTSIFAAALLLATAGCDQKTAAPANDTAAAPAEAAAGTVDGTWKADLASVQIDEQPSVYLLKDGIYSNSTAVPPLKVAADGAFHAVADQPYYDSMAVKVVDDHTVTMTRKKGDRVTGETTITASADGKTNTFTFKDMSTPNAPPVTGKGSETRVGPAPAGSHAISGSWKTEKYDNVSDEGLTFSFRTEGDTFSMTSPSGQSYAAKLDGSDTPIKGDTGGTVVAVERVAPNSIRETYKRGGKTVCVATYTPTADGKLSAVSENKLQKSTMRYTATKL
jgi:hypothetical protein